MATVQETRIHSSATEEAQAGDAMRKWTRQPPPNVRVNLKHPLAKGLVFAISGDTECVTGERGRIVGNGRFENTIYGRAFVSTSQAADGLGFYGNVLNRTRRMLSTTPGHGVSYYSIFYPTAWASNSKGMAWSIGTNATTWQTPFVGASFQDNEVTAGNSRFACMGSNVGSTAGRIGGPNVFTLNEWKRLGHSWVRPDDIAQATMVGILNGAAAVTTIDGAGSDLRFNNLSSGAPLSVFCRNTNDPGEGIEGYHVLSLFWNRPLTEAELRQIDANPWQLWDDQPMFATADVPEDNHVIVTPVRRYAQQHLFLGSSQNNYMEQLTPITTGPFTFFCFAYVPGQSGNANETMMGFFDPAVGADRQYFDLNAANVDGWGIQTGGDFSLSSGSTERAPYGTWQPCCLTHATNDNNIYFSYDRAADRSNTTGTMSIGGVPIFALGAKRDSTPNDQLQNNTRLANVAVWDAKLSPEEVYALISGVSPKSIRPGNLIYWYPFHDRKNYGRLGGVVQYFGTVANSGAGPELSLTRAFDSEVYVPVDKALPDLGSFEMPQANRRPLL